MSFELSPVEKHELRDVINMLFKAYDSESAFVNAIYPYTLTEDGINGLDMVVARLEYLRDVLDPSTQWWKVTDISTGEIILASQWNVYYKDSEKPPPMHLDGPPKAWKDETEKKYAIEMFKNFIAPREAKYAKDDVHAPIICLNIMGTTQKHRSKGAASLQIAYYNELADKLDAFITTESTIAAERLYKKYGYEPKQEFVVEAISEEFASRPKEKLIFMERERRSKRGDVHK
ncbi:hypothetical protein EJ05DRAFT_457158 [Pseudovirgaria hyperparasitica]|uniref:N-acetyltransferase domain-containing protein n=1 Tax=Pseudovirgaria hyperparasitica TaxID=470096 RepID=A0A6A6VW08_9PEZI|nr:uncharacterized protein EJ05DRAFT_457158 [Pseudovirgaria hyperparasitica]KAF2754345.1 hypothetical protein EJ05DRAFT_457158 [Pseudovirgaria hyperparasitica]